MRTGRLEQRTGRKPETFAVRLARTSETKTRVVATGRQLQDAEARNAILEGIPEKSVGILCVYPDGLELDSPCA
jgi:hypothetical protein